MELVLLDQAKKDLEFWKKSGNTQIQNRINQLIADTIQHPFSGIGKPEPLKGTLQGKWSRRINAEHRMIYSVSQGKIYLYILALRYHYNK